MLDLLVWYGDLLHRLHRLLLPLARLPLPLFLQGKRWIKGEVPYLYCYFSSKLEFAPFWMKKKIWASLGKALNNEKVTFLKGPEMGSKMTF
jgi:hypothetical protein